MSLSVRPTVCLKRVPSAELMLHEITLSNRKNMQQTLDSTVLDLIADIIAVTR